MTVRSSDSLRALVRQMLDIEAATGESAEPSVPHALRVFDRLRVAMSQFAGSEGFVSLMRRALAMARRDVPAVQHLTLDRNGSLEGFAKLLAPHSPGHTAGQHEDAGTEAAVEVMTNLLGLLVVFVGDGFTIKLVRDCWPDASLNQLQWRSTE